MKPLDALRWIWRVSELDLKGSAVMTALVLRADESGECYPGLATIAREAKVSLATVKRVLRTLSDAGLIERRQQTEPGKQEWARTVYRVQVGSGGAEVGSHRANGRLRGSQHVGSPGAQVGSQAHHETDLKAAREVASPDTELPIELPKELPNKNKLVPLASARSQARRAGRPQRRARASKPDPLAESTQAVTAKLDRLLKENGYPGVGNWGAARKIAASIVRGGVPVDEAMAALEWAFTDSRQRERLAGGGMKVVRAIWAAWRERKPRAADDGGTAAAIANYARKLGFVLPEDAPARFGGLLERYGEDALDDALGVLAGCVERGEAIQDPLAFVAGVLRRDPPRQPPSPYAHLPDWTAERLAGGQKKPPDEEPSPYSPPHWPDYTARRLSLEAERARQGLPPAEAGKPLPPSSPEVEPAMYHPKAAAEKGPAERNSEDAEIDHKARLAVGCQGGTQPLGSRPRWPHRTGVSRNR